MPNFTKYDGTRCVRAHLKWCKVKAIKYIYNAKLMIFCFQESLIGAVEKLFSTTDVT